MPRKKQIPVQVARCDTLNWVMAETNEIKTLKYLKETYLFHDIDLDDVGPPIQSPKIAFRPDYTFIVLQYPFIEKKNGIVRSVEVDFFIQKNELITVNTNQIPILQELFNAFKNSSDKDKDNTRIVANSVPELFYMVINTLTESAYPLLRSMSSDLEMIEDRMFEEFDKNLIKELLRLKTNIVNFRQSFQHHDVIFERLIKHYEAPLKRQKHLNVYYQQLIDDVRDINSRIELKKNTIDALHETNQSLTDFHTNEIIKTLTIVSFIVFPLTLLAGIFGMNAINMPFVNHPSGFWFIIGIMLAACASMLMFFKYKKWM